MRHLRFLGKLLLGVSSKFLCASSCNIYCKKDYSKCEVHVFEITQIKLQKKEEEYSYDKFSLFG